MTKFQLPKRVIPKKVTDVLLAFCIFLAVGYFPAFMLKFSWAGQASMVLAACAAIPYGVTSRRLRQGLLRGLFLGLLAGVATAAGLMNRRAIPPANVDRVIILLPISTALLCAAVAGIFAHTANRRRQRAEKEWDNQ